MWTAARRTYCLWRNDLFSSSSFNIIWNRIIYCCCCYYKATISAGCIEGISRVFLKCVYFCWTTATSSKSRKMRWAEWICWKSSPLTATNWPTFQPVCHRRRSHLCTWRAIELRRYGLQISSVSDDWISFIWRPTLLSRSRRGLSINWRG